MLTVLGVKCSEHWTLPVPPSYSVPAARTQHIPPGGQGRQGGTLLSPLASMPGAQASCRPKQRPESESGDRAQWAPTPMASYRCGNKVLFTPPRGQNGDIFQQEHVLGGGGHLQVTGTEGLKKAPSPRGREAPPRLLWSVGSGGAPHARPPLCWGPPPSPHPQTPRAPLFTLLSPPSSLLPLHTPPGPGGRQQEPLLSVLSLAVLRLASLLLA